MSYILSLCVLSLYYEDFSVKFDFGRDRCRQYKVELEKLEQVHCRQREVGCTIIASI